MAIVQKIAPCLWFDHQAEEAARFYVSIFDNSAIGPSLGTARRGSRFTAAARIGDDRELRLDGQEFTALNGGPHFKFTEADSFVVRCETQAEVDRYWEKLGEGGDERAQQCGWLKDKFGVSWQIVPMPCSR